MGSFGWDVVCHPELVERSVQSVSFSEPRTDPSTAPIRDLLRMTARQQIVS